MASEQDEDRHGDLAAAIAQLRRDSARLRKQSAVLRATAPRPCACACRQATTASPGLYSAAPSRQDLTARKRAVRDSPRTVQTNVNTRPASACRVPLGK